MRVQLLHRVAVEGVDLPPGGGRVRSHLTCIPARAGGRADPQEDPGRAPPKRQTPCVRRSQTFHSDPPSGVLHGCAGPPAPRLPLQRPPPTTASWALLSSPQLPPQLPAAPCQPPSAASAHQKPPGPFSPGELLLSLHEPLRTCHAPQKSCLFPLLPTTAGGLEG